MAPAAARVALETLLRARKLDTTLKTAEPSVDVVTDHGVTTGLPLFDRALAGGLPRGQVSELIGPLSSGRTSIGHALLAGATARGELAAIVDVCDSFDPAAAAGAGVRLDQVLWVRGEPATATTPALDPAWEPSRPQAGRAATPLGRALTRGVKALSLILSAGGFGVVIFDVSGMPMRALRQLPFTTWLRLQRMIEGTDTACVLLADEPLAHSAGGATIRLGALTAAGPPVPGVRGQTASFHDRVLARRHPFTPGYSPARHGLHPAASRAARAMWLGSERHARRFHGLALTAHAQCGLRTATCDMTLAR